NLAKRQANAAVALLKMDHPAKVWPLLRHSPDSRARSYMVHRLGPEEADPLVLIKRLGVEPDITIRRAVVLSVGEFGERELGSEQRKLFLDQLRELYSKDPDAGLHGAIEWLLRQWKQDQWLRQVQREWSRD